MLDLSIYAIITALSSLVIISYIFLLVGTKTRIPMVLMLLVLGMLIREVSIQMGVYVDIPLDFIQFFGVLGLILILLEAGLDLNVSKEKLPLVRLATASSIFVLAASSIGIAALIHFILDQSWRVSFIYAVPLSVISSTIVASSIHYLSEAKREFLTYESSLSDIFGILLFNILITDGAIGLGLITYNAVSIVVALAISVVVSIGLIYLLAKVDVNVKAFLIFAVLLLIYSLGHLWSVPTLLAVLVFGLIINNWRVKRLSGLRKYLDAEDVSSAADSVKMVTNESAFLIKTLFFTLFGYTINIHSLFNTKVFLVGTAVVLVIFLVRYAYLRILVRDHILPELFFAPRGLVTIVLFYSIPATLTFDSFDDGILFYVIVMTTLIMMFGSMLFTPRESTREAEEERRGWRGIFSRRSNDL